MEPIEVEGPDGTIIEFPAGTDRATIQQVMRRQFGGPQGGARSGSQSAPPQSEAYWSEQFEQATGRTAAPRGPDLERSRAAGSRAPSGPAGYVAGGLAEGLNLSDELRGVGARVGNFYDSVTGTNRAPLDPGVVAQAERDRVEQARTDQPLQQGLREGVGILPTAAFGGTGTQGAALGGAAVGSLVGYGSGETAQERATGTVVGAGVGAALGAGADLAGRGLGRLASPLARAVQRRFQGSGSNMTRAQRRAIAELRGAFQEEGRSGREVMDILRQYQDSGFDDATLMDAGAPGGPVQRLIRGAGTRGGDAGNALEGQLQARLETQADRVASRLSRYLSSVDDFGQQVDDLVRARAQRAAPLYEAAFGAGAPETMPRDAVAPILARTSRRDQAMARRLAQREGRTVSFDGDGPVTVQDMHFLKRALDDQVRSLGPEERRAVLELKRDLMAAMPESYREAANAFAGDSALVDALEAGRAALRGDSEAVEASVSAMSDSERQMFRAGLVRAAREQVERTNENSDVVRRLIGTEDRRRRLAAAFDTPQQFDEFERALRAEQDRVRNARFAAPSTGSQTAMRGLDAGRETRGALGDVIRGDFLGAMNRMREVGQQATAQMRRSATDRQLVALATRAQQAASPDAQALILDQIAQEYGEEVAQRVRDVVVAGAIPAGAVAAN